MQQYKYLYTKRAVAKWYYAYTIEDDTIKVVDVCHVQNMHE